MKKRKRPRLLDRSRDIPIDTVVYQGVPVQRALQHAGNHAVMLFHIRGQLTHVPITTPLLELIFGDPRKYAGLSFILRESSQWSKAGQDPTATFNCHSYSLGERIGLSARDWVQGEPTDLSMDTNPMAQLLRVYFRQVRMLDVAHAGRLVDDKRLQEDDIISFTYDRPYWGTVHAHSGRVRTVCGENWLASKFQVGRLLVTTLAEALELYPETKTVRAYRFCGC